MRKGLNSGSWLLASFLLRLPLQTLHDCNSRLGIDDQAEVDRFRRIREQEVGGAELGCVQVYRLGEGSILNFEDAFFGGFHGGGVAIPADAEIVTVARYGEAEGVVIRRGARKFRTHGDSHLKSQRDAENEEHER